jgi:hypothetical protein
MFNRSLVDRYFDHKNNPEPAIEVTEAEFIRLWIENGGVEEKAQFNLNIAKALGSSVEIGNKMYKPVLPKG